MKFDLKILILSLTLAVLLIVADVLIDNAFFYDIQVSFGATEIAPANELFMRILLFFSVVLFGSIVSYLQFRSNEAEKRLGMDALFLEQLLEAIPVPVFYKDRNYIYLGCNDSFVDFLGRPREEIVGKSVFDLAPDKLAQIYHEKDVELMENPGVQIYESRVRQSDGTEANVIFHKATFLDIEGEVNGMIGVILDISELRRAEAEKEDTIAQLKQALAQVKTLKGFLPICASCKKIRDDSGFWQRLEHYIREHSEAEFSHSICPECSKKLIDDYKQEQS